MSMIPPFGLYGSGADLGSRYEHRLIGQFLIKLSNGKQTSEGPLNHPIGPIIHPCKRGETPRQPHLE